MKRVSTKWRINGGQWQSGPMPADAAKALAVAQATLDTAEKTLGKLNIAPVLAAAASIVQQAQVHAAKQAKSRTPEGRRQQRESALVREQNIQRRIAAPLFTLSAILSAFAAFNGAPWFSLLTALMLTILFLMSRRDREITVERTHIAFERLRGD